MDKSKILSFLVEPLNGQEKDSMIYVYMRMVEIFNSCTTIEQLDNMKWWAWQTFEARFPGNYSLFTSLKWTYRNKYDSLINEMLKDKTMENKKEESPLINGLKEFLDEVPPERLKELEKYNQFGPTVPDYLELIDDEKRKENIYLTSYKLRMELGDLKKNNTNGVECAVLRDAINLLYRMENEIFELRKNGWHPASEPPVIPEGKFSVHVMAYCHTPSGIYAPVEIAYTRTGGWQYESVNWWCYPPIDE